MKALLLVALVACGGKGEDKPPPPKPPEPAPLPPVDREALLAGQLPAGAPESEVINVQCRVCHNVEYVTQQRLSEAGWKKTLEKMRTFGAAITEADVGPLAAFAARHWNADLPDRTYKPVPPPEGAVTAATDDE